MPDVKCPVFLSHGTKDDFVPFAMMGRLAAQARVPVTVVPVEGADHNDIFMVGGEDLMQEIRAVHSIRSPRTFARNR